MKEKAIGKIIGGLLICLMLGLVFGGLIDTTSAAQPDLMVDNIWIEPVEFHPGDTVKLYARIKNIGTGDAVGTFKVKRYYNDHVSTSTKDGLAAGKSFKTWRSWAWPSDCNSHTIKVVVNNDGTIAESNEGNNERSESFSAICEEADLTVTSVNAPTSAKPGGYVAVSWTVKSQGNAPSGSFYNRISLATVPYGTDISLGNFPMSSIAPGSSSSDAQVPKIPETVSPGYYYVTVFADAFQTVSESDEYNNINKAPNQIHIASENHPPNRPTNIAPSDGATGISLTPTLSASAFSDPDSGDTHWKTWWDVKRADNNALVWDSDWRTFDLTSTTVPSGKLDDNTTYKWRVRYMDNHGTWSEPLPIATTFTTLSENHPPNRPTNIAPSDGATGISLTPTLSASAFSDPDSGDTHWKTWWDVKRADNNALVWDSDWRTFDLTSTTVPSGKLDDNTTYKWRVRYMDNHGTWSEPLPIATTFTTLSENHPPNRPTNIAPSDGATGISLTPTLSASAFSDPDSGDTHWKTWWDVKRADNNALVWDSDWRTFDLTSTTVPSGKLDDNTTYKWRVRYMDNHGTWSEPLPIATTFTTLSENHPPNRPTNIAPSDGATDVSLTPSLSASAFSDPDSGDTHWKTWWDVKRADNNALAWDSGWRTFDLTSTTVPSGKLDDSTTYKWRVRYMDNHGTWSEPLPIATTFTTLSENQPPNRPTNIAPSDFKISLGFFLMINHISKNISPSYCLYIPFC